MKKNKLKLKDSLYNKILEIFSHEKRGRLLDLGCGAGEYANGLKKLGFDVVASDRVKGTRYKYHGVIDFKACDISEKLPFNNEEFDHVLFLRILEGILILEDAVSKQPYSK